MPALALTVSSELQPWCPDFFCFPPPCSWTHLYERSESQPMIRRRERRATREGLISHRWESSWFSSCPAPRRLEVCPVRFHHQDSRTRGFSCGASWSWSWICLSPVQWGGETRDKKQVQVIVWKWNKGVLFFYSATGFWFPVVHKAQNKEGFLLRTKWKRHEGKQRINCCSTICGVPQSQSAHQSNPKYRRITSNGYNKP